MSSHDRRAPAGQWSLNPFGHSSGPSRFQHITQSRVFTHFPKVFWKCIKRSSNRFTTRERLRASFQIFPQISSKAFFSTVRQLIHILRNNGHTVRPESQTVWETLGLSNRLFTNIWSPYDLQKIFQNLFRTEIMHGLRKYRRTSIIFFFF